MLPASIRTADAMRTALFSNVTQSGGGADRPAVSAWLAALEDGPPESRATLVHPTLPSTLP